MAGSSVIRGLACVILLFTAIEPDHASAFCRESVMSEPSGPCVETPGVPLLHWTRDCVTYAFNDKMFRLLSPLTEPQVRSTFETSFQTWADVDCADARSPFFVEQAPGTTATSNAEFVYDEPNESVIVARDRSEWSSLPNHDPTALAFTLLWHDKNTGEILDVDMELNVGAGKFSDCTKGCSSNMVDLQNTVTHEAGHLLGLGHTSVRGATMTTTAIGAETEKRSLETDDKKGYCSLELPEFECTTNNCLCPTPPVFRSKPETRGCSCRTAGTQHSGAPLLPLALGAGALLLRIRRRRAAIRSA
jgi:MYXO-CTERM domain-containing protein